MKDLSLSLFQESPTVSESDLELSAKNALDSAIILSLFTDARVAKSDEKRGYWGDSLTENQGPLGSELWTLNRAKLNDETIDAAGQYALESIEWMRKVDMVQDMEVGTESRSGQLILNIKFYMKGRAPYSVALATSEAKVIKWSG